MYRPKRNSYRTRDRTGGDRRRRGYTCRQLARKYRHGVPIETHTPVEIEEIEDNLNNTHPQPNSMSLYSKNGRITIRKDGIIVVQNDEIVSKPPISKNPLPEKSSADKYVEFIEPSELQYLCVVA